MSRLHFPIHHTFGPLATKEQARLAFRLQFQPKLWRTGPAVEELRSALSHAFGMSASLFATGREALLAVLKTLTLGSGDEIIVQAFTCAVVPNAVHAAGAVPVYCDIDPATLSLDLKKIQSKITPRTKAIVCQHTFGIPAPTEQLRAICDKRRLLLIEDAAHILPDVGRDGQMSLVSSPGPTETIGRFGDILLFSFGRDKAISGVTGGAALTRHGDIGRALATMEKTAFPLSRWDILNLLGYPIRYRFARALWRLPVGGAALAKTYLRFSRVTKLLPRVLTDAEKEGKMAVALHLLPNVCAMLILQQLQTLARFNDHRRALTSLYARAAREGKWRVPAGAASSPALQKFPLYVENADGLRATLKHEEIYLDDGWSGAVINPRTVNQELCGYAPGSCPVAEEVAQHILTLPLHPLMTEQQAKYLAHALRSLL